MKIRPCGCMGCMPKMYCPFYNPSIIPYPYSYYEPAFYQDSGSHRGDAYENEDKDILNTRAANFAGTWQSTYGRLEMTQYGNNVRGVYPTIKTSSYFKNWTGKLEGTVSGDTMMGNWSESRYPGHFAQGRFSFRLLPDGNHFVGTRGEGDKFVGGPWDAHRV